MVRTRCCDQSGFKKGTWTPEEDSKLVAYVTRYGCWNWRLLPKFAGLARCGKSCRLRWMNYLRPDIKRGNYTPQEEDTIIRLHHELGNRWSAIAAHLPGRTDNEIKNHWHSSLKKRFEQKSDTHGEAIVSTQNHQATPSKSSHEVRNSVTNGTATVTSLQCDSGVVESQITDPILLASADTCASSSTGNFDVKDYDDWAFLEHFWSEPFMVDVSYVPNEQLPLSPQYDFDAKLWGHYDECIGLF